MSTHIKGILVVGGGDAGCLTALCIRQLNPNLQITVVDDFDSEQTNIGKSTYIDITYVLHEFLQIPEERFLRTVKPIWKGSVYFREWCNYDPFHYPFDDLQKYPTDTTPNAGEQHFLLYDELQGDPSRRTVNEAMVEEDRAPVYFQPLKGNYGRYRSYAYHFDTERFNPFLRKLCSERDIDLVNDIVVDVDTSNGTITEVTGQHRSYSAELFVDASGFERVLKSEMNDSFKSFEIPLDSAFNAEIDQHHSEAEPATIIETGEFGWFWQIDTYDHRDVGYVYASDFTSTEEAKIEFIDHFDELSPDHNLRHHTFSSGYFPTAWEGNCVTIGNAEGFVEPLQSTGLTANAMAATKLASVLATHGCYNHAGGRSLYINWVRKAWESIYDFICVHYMYANGSNEFWDTMRSIQPSPRLKRIIELFDENGYDTVLEPIENDDEIDNLLIFPLSSFYTIMRCMGATSRFYESNDFSITEETKRRVEEYYSESENRVEEFLTIEEVYSVLATQ